MKRLLLTGVALFGIAFTDVASSCFSYEDKDADDLKFSEIIVFGMIKNYEIISRKGYNFDYAQFDIVVSEVLRGEAPKTLSVNWENSTFKLPENLNEDLYLIALRTSPKTNKLTVLQQGCSGPFMRRIEDKDLDKVRKFIKEGADTENARELIEGRRF